jgi:Na+/H+ antiporter NhaD/arsenite permease-like protein
MLLGAFIVIITGQISPIEALKPINIDVILFLFGMFVVGSALEESGYIYYLSCNIFRKAKSTDHLILFILFGFGIMSAFLMNDTVAIIGTPVVLLLAKKYFLPPKLMLLTLAFAVTIGSVMSPIGNPQNLLIALNGKIGNPFITFFKFLLIPTIINLFLTYILLKFFYRKQFHAFSQKPIYAYIKDRKLSTLSKISLVLIIILVAAKIAMVFLNLKIDFSLTYIALLASLPIILFSPKRLAIIMNIDWHTLIFFASMFILMESVWQTRFFQSIITKSNINITSIPVILAVSIIISQFISNVPMVALYLPMLVHVGASVKELIALAAGSTIAGNLFILGAASNVIIIQNAEKKSSETLTFLEFAKIEIPLTIINTIIYWLFLAF